MSASEALKAKVEQAMEKLPDNTGAIISYCKDELGLRPADAVLAMAVGLAYIIDTHIKDPVQKGVLTKTVQQVIELSPSNRKTSVEFTEEEKSVMQKAGIDDASIAAILKG